MTPRREYRRWLPFCQDCPRGTSPTASSWQRRPRAKVLPVPPNARCVSSCGDNHQATGLGRDPAGAKASRHSAALGAGRVDRRYQDPLVGGEATAIAPVVLLSKLSWKGPDVIQRLKAGTRRRLRLSIFTSGNVRPRRERSNACAADRCWTRSAWFRRQETSPSARPQEKHCRDESSQHSGRTSFEGAAEGQLKAGTPKPLQREPHRRTSMARKYAELRRLSKDRIDLHL